MAGPAIVGLMSILTFYSQNLEPNDGLDGLNVRERQRRVRRYMELYKRREAIYRRSRRRRRILALAVISLAYASTRIVDIDQARMPVYTVWFEEAVMLHYTDNQWLKNFRMKKRTFLKLCDDLRPSLEHQTTNCKQPISVEKRVAVAVWRLATPCEYRTIALLFGIGRSTACKITREVCNAIFTTLYPQYIKWPTGDRLKKVLSGFLLNHGVPQCAGAVDGTHIHVAPPEASHNDYHNRKGFTSIVLQAVCDYQCRFIDIFAGFAGRAHDARILVNSELYQRGQNGRLFPRWRRRIENVDVPVYIVGDPAYPLLPWIMKAFPENANVTRQQKHFNYKLSSARILIELTFGQLKGRWRCLNKKNESHIDFMPLIVACCCILHNYCIDNEDPFRREPLDLPEDFDNLEVHVLDGGQEGADDNHEVDEDLQHVNPRAVRQALLEYFQRNR